MAAGNLIVLLAAAQATPAPEALPRIIESIPCRGPVEEIVVCGRRPPVELYRIPPELRMQPLELPNYSWAGRARDEREADRFDGQAVGPGGVFLHSRQVDCGWRAERQEIAGTMIDCSVHVGFGAEPDE
jgi:hypothetical protein